MAEKKEDEEMITVIVPDESGPQDLDNEQEDGDAQPTRFHSQRDVVWNTICKYVSHLSNEEILETRRLFCGCVNSIIDAYEEKLREVQALKNKVRVWKQISYGQGETIKQLERKVIDLTEKLASKVCEDCGEKKITEQLGSLSMKEKKQSPETRSETDGGQAERNMEIDRGLRKRPRELEESDEDDLNSDAEDSTYKFGDVYKCQYASCGFDALLHMFYKMKINFCPSKLIQMIGAVVRDKGINCTNILNNVKDKEGRFLKKIYGKEGIDEGKQEQVLKEAEVEFNESKQKAGILSYRTNFHNHCVNIYKSKSGKTKIHDANGGKTYIEHLHQVHYLEVVVLNCDETGVPHIIKRWSKCHARHCKNELKTLSRPGNSESSPLEGILKDNEGLEQLQIHELGTEHTRNE